jgi:hypothetical protein
MSAAIVIVSAITSSAWASPELRRLSRQAVGISDTAFQQARYEAKANRPADRRALQALRLMTQSADHHFRAVLNNPRRSYRIFQGLVRDFREARYMVNQARFSYHVDRQMRDLAYTLQSIEYEYRY